MSSDTQLDKNRQIYDNADDEVWQRAVYQPVHDGWHFANIGGRKFLDLVGSDVELGPADHVLDLCCGSGAAAFYLNQHFNSSVTGLDLNHSQIERAKSHVRGNHQLHFEQADACVWQSKRRYDLAFSLDSMTLIHDLPALFRTCRDALRSGGRLEVADVVADATLSEEMRAFALAEDGAVNLVPADHLGAMIAAAGFDGVEVVSMRDEAVRAFTLIHQSVRDEAKWPDIPSKRIEEWKNLSERYLNAFVSGELDYVRIGATRP